MKSKEELEALKKEMEDLAKKLSELTEDELKEIGLRVVPPSELTDEQLEAISGGQYAGIDQLNILTVPVALEEFAFSRDEYKPGFISGGIVVVIPDVKW